MKKRAEAIIGLLKSAIQQHPVEVFTSIAFCILGCIYYETGEQAKRIESLLTYFPVLFFITYTLNVLTIQKKIRIVYFLSVLFSLLLFWIAPVVWTVTYLVSLIVVQLFYLISGWKRNNNDFMQTGLHYLNAILSAGLLAGVTYLLSISIYLSIQYIFDIWQQNETRFFAYAAYIASMGIMPLLFLIFNQEKQGEELRGNKLFEVLLNYILTPVLLIYAGILYLYFIKIVILWSLPKGAVAYIVVSFVSATFILKGCQIFLSRRYFDWFYNYASLAVLPALTMYWVGTCYRINQYGFTEARVYLIVTGLILTGIALLFFSKRFGRYLYAACLAIVLLSVVTYIPGITAKDIERISQTKRGNHPLKDKGYYQYTSLQIENSTPMNISGYQTIQTVHNYKPNNGMWASYSNDSLSLYSDNKQLIFKEDMKVLFNKQLSKAGLSPIDSIQEKAYSDLLCLEMDSALLMFETISIYRYSPDSTYTVSYMNPAFYLKKGL